ncbi:MAG TPA: hypothetical protein VH475_22675 [Tepidisphaeraceae bacterium]
MRRSMALIGILATIAFCIACGRYDGEPTPNVRELSLKAASADPTVARPAIAAVRAWGQSGLDTMLYVFRDAVRHQREDPTHPEATWPRIAAAIDAVAAQKDAWASELYWYTDLDAAKREAKRTGKPILSLRLLGTLDTEFSCANSRFFRTVLYPNQDVRQMLRNNYVLHWQSHRPVPHLTIDFGDGRKIERTITGNSVHYVLTPDGKVIDALPGLYGPAPFLKALQDLRTLAATYEQPDFASRLVTYHEIRLELTRRAWAEDLLAVGASTAQMSRLSKPAGNTSAWAATRITAAKAAAETGPVVALSRDRAALAKGTDDATWTKIAALHTADGRLDAASRAVILSKVGNGAGAGANAVAANNRTVGKRIVEDPVTRLVRNFERSVAEDTARNEYGFHTQIHDWFVSGQIPASLDDLNERVYAELFLMPKTDPWLGLVPADAYTALPTETPVARAPRP